MVSCYITQGAQLSTLWWSRGVGWEWEVGLRWRGYIDNYDIHVAVWQKATQLGKAIILQLKKKRVLRALELSLYCLYAVPVPLVLTTWQVSFDFDICKMGFLDSSIGKESTCNAGDSSLIPGSGRSTGEGIGYPCQYSWASLWLSW